MSERETAKQEWLEKTRIIAPGSFMHERHFVPKSGLCYSCRGDLIKHYMNTGVYSSTGCPLCNCTFCD